MTTLLSSKSQLNEFCQVRKLLLPSYDTRFQGPPHARLFQSTVTISDQAFAGEECTTKKAAEQSAADIALAALKKQYEESDKQNEQQNAGMPGAPKRRFSGEVRGGARGGRKKRRGGSGTMDVMTPPGYTAAPPTNGEQVHDVAAIATQLDHRLSVKHQQALPDVNSTTAVASLIHVTNEILGTFREAHKLVEFKLTKAYAQGLLTKDELVIDAAVVFAEAPSKQMIIKLAMALKPMYESHLVEAKGSIVVISNATLTLNLATTYLQAWQGDFKLYADPNSPDYVDIAACQTALLNIRQVLWFEPNFLRICAPNPRIIAKLFRLLAKRTQELSRLSHFEQLVLIYWALKDPPPPLGLSGALRQIFSYLASGDLYPGGNLIVNPVKDYKIHLFSKLTREEEIQLADYTRELHSPNIPPSKELELLFQKALEPDPNKVIPIVEWAQKTIKQIAFTDNGWETLFGGLPPATPVEQAQMIQ